MSDELDCDSLSDGDCTTIVTCENGKTVGEDEHLSRDLVVVANPTGSGGKALTCNFKELHFRQPKCRYSANSGVPTNDDGAENYCVGSRWLDQALKNRMWINVVATTSGNGAVWVPWARWQDEASWYRLQDGFTRQKQVLVYDFNFAVDGEYRRFDNDNDNSPVILTPKGTDTQSAIIHGRHGAAPGGDDRGAKAVDLQNTRADEAQVASGQRSFIAAGQNNTASGNDAHAQGVGTVSAANASHAQGIKTLVGDGSDGSHAQGYCDTLGNLAAAA